MFRADVPLLAGDVHQVARSKLLVQAKVCRCLRGGDSKFFSDISAPDAAFPVETELNEFEASFSAPANFVSRSLHAYSYLTGKKAIPIMKLYAKD